MRSIKVATHPFLAEMDSHFAHLGPGANHAPVAEHLRCEFAAEIERARHEDDELLQHSGGSHELACVFCDDCGEAIRAADDAVENLRARTVHHATCLEATKFRSNDPRYVVLGLLETVCDSVPVPDSMHFARDNCFKARPLAQYSSVFYGKRRKWLEIKGSDGSGLVGGWQL